MEEIEDMTMGSIECNMSQMFLIQPLKSWCSFGISKSIHSWWVFGQTLISWGVFDQVLIYWVVFEQTLIYWELVDQTLICWVVFEQTLIFWELVDQTLTTLGEGLKLRYDSMDASDTESTTDTNDLRDLDDSASDVSYETRASSVASLDLETKSPAEAHEASFLKLPTEMLQAIFLELPTLGDAKAVTRTCPRLRDAFKGYEKTIILTILSRELGPTLPGTLGALAIFVSPPKGPFDEPLLRNMAISILFWKEMLEETEELAKKMITLTMATWMLDVYRQFPQKIGHRSGKCNPDDWCSACTSAVFEEENWNPINSQTDDHCIDHLLQANAVRYRLNCRMVLGSTAPDESPEDDRHIGSSWHPSRIARKIIRIAQSKPDDESELDYDSELGTISELENDSDYDNDSGYEDGPDLENDLDPGKTPIYEAGLEQEDVFELDQVSQQYRVYLKDDTHQEDEICPKDETHQEDEIFAEYEIYPEDRIRQENELLREFDQMRLGMLVPNFETMPLLD